MTPSEPAPFALSPDGTTLAAGDGPELLTWRADGAPAWRQFTDGVLVGVAVGLEHVVSVDADGRLARRRRTDGEVVDLQMVAGQPRGLALARDGVTVAVLTAEGPVVITPGMPPRLVPIPGATACGFGPGAGALGVGTATGRFVAVEVATGAPWGECQLDAPLGGVAWSAQGSWLVGAGRMLARVSGDGKSVQALIPGADHAMDQVACSDNGLVVAARAGDRVELYELHANRPIGEFLLRRRIGEVCFGPGLLLGIGLDDGDANLVELGSGATFRTEPHPGRGRSTWRLENKVDPGAVRGAIVLHQAGGQPIARYVPPPSSEEAGSGGGCLAGCVSVFGLVLVMSAFGAFLLIVMYVLRTYGLWQYLPLR